MTMDDITAMDMDATNIVTAMLSGSVDAVSYTHLDVYKRQRQ